MNSCVIGALNSRGGDHKIGSDKLFGIEVEVEANRPLPNLSSAGWITVGEGSLRGHGAEYIFPTPYNTKERNNSVDALHDALHGKDWVFKDSPRTSVHVHLNIKDLEPVPLCNAIISYWLIENLLFKYCGSKREGNLFCRRLKDADGIVTVLDNSLKSVRDKRSLRRAFALLDRNPKYMGLNLATIQRIGSLEFRGMQGTTDKNIIKRWSDELKNLVASASAKFETPEHIFDAYFNNGPDYILNELLSEDFVNTLKKLSKNWEQDILENEEHLVDLAYSDNWSKLLSVCDEYRKWDRKKEQETYEKKYKIAVLRAPEVPIPAEEEEEEEEEDTTHPWDEGSRELDILFLELDTLHRTCVRVNVPRHRMEELNYNGRYTRLGFFSWTDIIIGEPIRDRRTIYQLEINRKLVMTRLLREYE